MVGRGAPGGEEGVEPRIQERRRLGSGHQAILGREGAGQVGGGGCRVGVRAGPSVQGLEVQGSGFRV